MVWSSLLLCGLNENPRRLLKRVQVTKSSCFSGHTVKEEKKQMEEKRNRWKRKETDRRERKQMEESS